MLAATNYRIDIDRTTQILRLEIEPRESWPGLRQVIDDFVTVYNQTAAAFESTKAVVFLQHYRRSSSTDKRP